MTAELITRSAAPLPQTIDEVLVELNEILDASLRGGGREPTRSWRAAFALLDDSRPLVVQHLLAGMNAHINLDLGIAAAAIAGTPAELEALRPDFWLINDLLARLVLVVEDELGELSPRLKRIEEFAPSLEDRVFDFAMDEARNQAWAFARRIVATPPAERGAVIGARDAEVAALAGLLYPLHGLPGAVERWIHEKESQDVRYNIQVVAG